jgi:hypothetical protein
MEKQIPSLRCGMTARKATATATANTTATTTARAKYRGLSTALRSGRDDGIKWFERAEFVRVEEIVDVSRSGILGDRMPLLFVAAG